MRIRTQFTILLILFSLMLVVIAALAMFTNRQAVQAVEQGQLAGQIAQGASELSYLSNDYLIYRESQQHRRWLIKYEAVAGQVADLNVTDPEQQALARSLRASAGRIKAVFDSLATADSSSPGSRADVTQLQIAWSRMAVQTQGLMTDANRLAALLQDQADRLTTTRTWLTYFMIAVFGAFLLLNYLAIQQRTLRSLSKLQAGTAVVGSGNLDFAIPVERHDEIGELTQAFNLMTVNLKSVTASRADLEREMDERRRAEAEIVRLNQSLARRAAELEAANLELQAARAELEERVQTRTSDLLGANRRLVYQAQLLEQVSDAVVATGRDNHITAYNRAAEELYGWAAHEIMGHAPDEIISSVFLEASRDQVAAELSAHGHWRGELLVYRRDGTCVYVESRAAQLRDEAGNITGEIWTSHDITDRKRAEDALKASRAELQAYARKLVDASENERRIIARELHDEAGQVVTSLKINLGIIQKDPACPPAIASRLDGLKQTADSVIDELRQLASDLRPGVLDRAGLVPAIQQHIRQFTERTGLAVELVAGGLDGRRLPAEIETNLYRITQEALTNVARYASATHAGVVLEQNAEQVVLIIEDDGIGFDPEEASRKGHLGLLGMRERAEMLHGTLDIETAPGRGTTVFVAVPNPETLRGPGHVDADQDGNKVA
jgi:two-component system, NarL family, sensor histidine kinase UhpB